MFYNVRINGRWETHLVWLIGEEIYFPSFIVQQKRGNS